MRVPQNHIYHHGRFYVAVAVGMLCFAVLSWIKLPAALTAAGDAFFVTYLAAAAGIVFKGTAAETKRRAEREDEGILVVVAITLAIIAINVTSVFLALNHPGKLDAPSLAVLTAAAPLGWCVLHTISTFHYANLFYFDPPGDAEPGQALLFPGTASPDLWDFVYFSFVIGMTAQVSDVQIQTGAMRRAVTGHAIVSFFFNTVLIALVINVVAGAH